MYEKNPHKCTEAQAPETLVYMCRQEIYQVNNDTENEAGEDIVLIESEMDLLVSECRH